MSSQPAAVDATRKREFDCRLALPRPRQDSRAPHYEVRSAGSPRRTRRVCRRVMNARSGVGPRASRLRPPSAVRLSMREVGGCRSLGVAGVRGYRARQVGGLGANTAPNSLTPEDTRSDERGKVVPATVKRKRRALHQRTQGQRQLHLTAPACPPGRLCARLIDRAAPPADCQAADPIGWEDA